jgi:hypothetical protein
LIRKGGLYDSIVAYSARATDFFNTIDSVQSCCMIATSVAIMHIVEGAGDGVAPFYCAAALTGLRCGCAPTASPTCIAGGDKWREELRKSAAACRVVICLVTENWLASEQCFGEFVAGNYIMGTGSCRRSQCCEPTAEERGAVNPHATFCGNRRRATASGDPVGGWQQPLLPRPFGAINCRFAT